MTQAQKIAKEKFKKAIEYRKKTGASLKEAFAHVYGKKVGAVKKKSASKPKYVKVLGQEVKVGTKLHEKLVAQKKYFDDLQKSEINGIRKKTLPKRKNAVKKKVGALPIDFKGNFLGYRFKVLNQYQLDGGVTAQLVELDGRGDIITELSGNTRENDRAAAVLYSGAIASGKDIYLDEKDKKDLQKRIKSFVVGLNKEVSAYNSGKDTSKKKSKGLKIVYKPEVKKMAVVDQIKSILKNNKKILKGGYSIKAGTIRESKVAGIKVVSGFIGRLIIKNFTLSELKKMNPIFFEKGKDASAGIYKRKLITSKKLNSQVMVEAKKDPITKTRSYGIRLINPEGSISIPKKFDTLFGAAEYIGKNIIL